MTKNVKNEIMVNGVKVDMVEFKGLNGLDNKEITVKVPKQWIFGATVQNGYFDFHFDLKGKKGETGYTQEIKFCSPVEKEIVRIWEGNISADFKYIALQSVNYRNGVESGYKTMSYSVMDKDGNYLFANLQSASAVSVIGKLLKLATNKQADNVYCKSVGRNNATNRNSVKVEMVANDSFNW
jgi:hypothetical protein